MVQLNFSLAWPMRSQIIPCHFDNKKLEENWWKYFTNLHVWTNTLVTALGVCLLVLRGVHDGWQLGCEPIVHAPFLLFCVVYFQTFLCLSRSWINPMASASSSHNGCFTCKSSHMSHPLRRRVPHVQWGSQRIPSTKLISIKMLCFSVAVHCVSLCLPFLAYQYMVLFFHGRYRCHFFLKKTQFHLLGSHEIAPPSTRAWTPVFLRPENTDNSTKFWPPKPGFFVVKNRFFNTSVKWRTQALKWATIFE